MQKQITIDGERYRILDNLTEQYACRTPNGGWCWRSDNSAEFHESPTRSTSQRGRDTRIETVRADGRDLAIIATRLHLMEEWDEWEELQVYAVRAVARQTRREE